MFYRQCVRQKKLRLTGLILSSVFMLFSQLSVLANPVISLSWNPSTNPNVKGYKIYFGTSSHNYISCVDVGNVTSASIPVPADGVTYYVAATAYDNSDGVESDFSPEMVLNSSSSTVAAAATLTMVKDQSGRMSLSVAGTAGGRYIIQASTNLVDWFPVQTNTAPFTFTNINPTALARCFYRSASL